MIGGVITVVALIVTRMPQVLADTSPNLPEEIVLPEGVEPIAVTFGQGWIAVVSDDDRIRIYGKEGQLRQDITLTQPEVTDEGAPP